MVIVRVIPVALTVVVFTSVVPSVFTLMLTVIVSFVLNFPSLGLLLSCLAGRLGGPFTLGLHQLTLRFGQHLVNVGLLRSGDLADCPILQPLRWHRL